MSDAPDAEEPSFPLLWDVFPSQYHDREDYRNLTLNVDVKGVYLRGLAGPALSTSHRLDLPFPLRSAVTGGDYQRRGDDSAASDGTALPLLVGDLGTGQSSGGYGAYDYEYGATVTYW